MSVFHRDEPQDEVFRTEVRMWLETNTPGQLYPRDSAGERKFLRNWHRALYDRGWIAPHWPREYGGMGATLEQQMILLEEQARAGTPYLPPAGLNFLGLAVMEFGTERQKDQFLPDILTGQTIWAQGYSEPEAGSDLASLTTRADLDDGVFVVNGQKIWTSHASIADWIFALVRTDRSAEPKQAGISMLLIDLRSKGINVVPIQTIVGDEQLGMVTFDDVRVPVANLLGPLHGGWLVTNHVLTFERLSGSSPRNALMALDLLLRTAVASGKSEDSAFLDRLAKAQIDLLAHIAIHRQAADKASAGRDLGLMTAVMKLVSTQALQGLTDLLLDAATDRAASRSMQGMDGLGMDPVTAYLESRRASIYGGTSEVQRNILAQRLLNFTRSWS